VYVFFSLQASEEGRPVWFVCSGMGAQWVGMCQSMMEFGPFKASMETNNSILEKVGYNLLDVLMTADDDMFDNPINSFTGIVAIQVRPLSISHVYSVVAL
jgi:fatty acid synthase